MIDGKQIRAARAMLGWSREDLLNASGISMSALLRMEGAMADSRSTTLNKVVHALNQAGIEFLHRRDGAIGIMLCDRNSQIAANDLHHPQIERATEVRQQRSGRQDDMR